MNKSYTTSKARKKPKGPGKRVRDSIDEALEMHTVESFRMDRIPVEHLHEVLGLPGAGLPLPPSVHHLTNRLHFSNTVARYVDGKFVDVGNSYLDDDEDDDDQPPMTPKLAALLKQVPPSEHYYVYDVHNYELRFARYHTMIRNTQDTLRIGVISPMIFATKQQNDDILNWAVKRELLPKTWERPDIVKGELSETMLATVEIVDTFVQCLLRSESVNLVKICVHIGEWYRYRDTEASHRMEKKYSLEPLRRDLNAMHLLPSVTLIYANHPEKLIWNIAVFVCHQFFFYLADNEYKEHSMMQEMLRMNVARDVEGLKDEGNQEFKVQKYFAAIEKYNEALMVSPYHHVVYANRAMAYLKLREIDKNPDQMRKYTYFAMCDAFRCIKIDPLYVKGYDRYAVSLDLLNRTEEALNILETAIRTLKNQSHEQRIPDAIFADGIRSLENRKLKLRPEPPAEISSSNKDKHDMSKSSKAKNSINGSKDSEKLKKSSTSSNSSNIKTAATNKKAVKVEGAFGNDLKKATVTSNEPSSTKTTTSTTNSKPSKNKNSPPSEKEAQEALLAQEMKKLQEIQNQEIRRTRAIDDLKISLRDGSMALLDGKFKFAINLYEKCFTLIQQFTAVDLGQSVEDVLVLRYARGVAYISHGPYEDIILGVKEMRHIMENQPSPTMKAISLYELAIAYAKQHRYTEAIEPINESLGLCKSKKGLKKAFKWPGTERFIEHTDANQLRKKLLVLQRQCTNPPQPDYICRANTCLSYGHAHNSIYIEDPRFKGYTCVLCTEKCKLHYHRDCWKKTHLEVDRSCITPDCGGFVFKCIHFTEDASREHEDKSSKYPLKLNHKGSKKKPPPLKLPTISAVKLKQKQAKKLQRKANKAAEKRRLAGESDDETAEDTGNLANQILADSDKPAAVEEKAEKVLRGSPVLVQNKRKDEENEAAAAAQAAASKHNNRRRDKAASKQVMSLDEFCGTSASAGVEDTGSTYSSGSLGIDPDKPFRIPSQLRDNLAKFESEYQSEHLQLPVVIQGIDVAQLQKHVNGFYHDMLESKGPMTADCKEMTDFLEYEEAAKELVKLYGGLANFLETTGGFVLVENLICVHKDLKKAKEMTESVRGVKHGVSVVPHDFKAQLERASAYKPERKKYSGYEETTVRRPKPLDTMWQHVVEDWNHTDLVVCENSYEDEERERSQSVGSDFVDDGNEAEKAASSDRQPIKVEKLSPTLLEEWKKAQTQGMISSLDKKTTKDDSETHTRQRSASGDSFVRQTASVDSVLSTKSTGSDIVVPSRTSSNGSAQSSHSRIATPPAYVDFTQPPPPPPNGGGLNDFSRVPTYRPNNTPSPPVLTSGYGGAPYPAPTVFGQSYARPQPMGYGVQPIGTPAVTSIGYGIMPMPAPVQQPMTQLANYGVNMPWSQGSNAAQDHLQMQSAQQWRPREDHCAFPQSEGKLKSSETTETQTENETADKMCNTEYEYMDDYDKKVEECNRLHERLSDTMDKFHQLKQTSTTEKKDLDSRLKEATRTEKVTSSKYEKLVQTSEKESRRWKDEKKSVSDEMAAVKKSAAEAKWKMEEKECKVKELEERMRNLTNSYQQEVDNKDAELRQINARYNAVENQAKAAELEVIDVREKYTLFKCVEALDNTNKSIDQQRAQVERFLQQNPGQPLPTLMSKNAQLAAQRRQLLMDTRDETMAVYESQREAIKSGAISLASLPQISPPGLLEIIASTSLPMPPRQPMPMMNHMAIRPGMMPPHIQGQQRRPLLPTPRSAGSPVDDNPGHQEPSIPEPTPTSAPQERPPAAATPPRDQASRRNAAETQLITDIQHMFPNLTGDDVRSYIGKLRQRRQGQGLTGLKLVDLKRQIIELVLEDHNMAVPMNGNTGAHQQGLPSALMPNPVQGDKHCIICHDRLSTKQNRKLQCNHQFHAECIDSWLMRQDTCPMCRRRVN